MNVSGIVKDYFYLVAMANGKPKHYWCSSSSWIFSELPDVLENKEDLAKLMAVNNFFTGEFDSVIFASSGKPVCIDAELGVFMQPKPITELDRLSCCIHEINKLNIAPKGLLKNVPSGVTQKNEGFKGLNQGDCFSLDCW